MGAIFQPLSASNADVAELVDALDSGSSGGNPVEVRFLSSAPKLKFSHLISIT